MPFTMTARVERDVLGPLTSKIRRRLELVGRVAAHNIEREAKTLVPVDTGATKNSISVDDAGRLAWRIGAKTEYAPHLEFGTIPMLARPYLTPALEHEAPRFVRAVGEIIG